MPCGNIAAMRPFRRPTLVVALGWVAAALVATVAGLGGIRLVGDSLTGTPGGVLTEEDVRRALGTQPSVAAGGSSGAPTATSKMGSKPAATRVEASFSTSGGTVIARCTGAEAYLVSWSPRPGYRVDRAEQGPDHEVEVRFEGDAGRSELKISCSDGTPVAETKDDD